MVKIMKKVIPTWALALTAILIIGIAGAIAINWWLILTFKGKVLPVSTTIIPGGPTEVTLEPASPFGYGWGIVITVRNEAGVDVTKLIMKIMHPPEEGLVAFHNLTFGYNLTAAQPMPEVTSVPIVINGAFQSSYWSLETSEGGYDYYSLLGFTAVHLPKGTHYPHFEVHGWTSSPTTEVTFNLEFYLQI